MKKEKVEEKIGNFLPAEFGGWLIKGIKDWSQGNVGAFSPLYYLINNENLIFDLRNIYDALSDRSQENFRKGIAIALSGYPKKINRKTAISLLYLAGKINCKEIQPVINNWLDQLDMEKEFYALVLSVVAELSPANGVAHTLRKIVGVKELFHYKYTPLVFTALCRAKPEKFFDHLKLLRDHFKILHEKEGDADAYMTARRITYYVSLDIITNNLWRFKEADKWLVKAFFVGEKAPLIIKYR